jgi:hypothetical protein
LLASCNLQHCSCRHHAADLVVSSQVSCGAQELMCATFRLWQISVIALIGFGVANRILYKVRSFLAPSLSSPHGLQSPLPHQTICCLQHPLHTTLCISYSKSGHATKLTRAATAADGARANGGLRLLLSAIPDVRLLRRVLRRARHPLQVTVPPAAASARPAACKGYLCGWTCHQRRQVDIECED